MSTNPIEAGRSEGGSAPVLEINGRDRIELTSAHRYCEVVEGRAHLFIRLTRDDGNPSGYVKLAARAEAGTILALPSVDFSGMVLILSGVGAARVRFLSQDELVMRAASHSDGLKPLEPGLKALADARPLPGIDTGASYVLTHGEVRDCRSDGTVTAHDLACLRIERSQAAAGEDNSESERPAAHTGFEIAASHHAVPVEAGASVEAISLSDAVDKLGWAPLTAWVDRSFLAIGQELAGTALDARTRLERARANDAEELDRALVRLPVIVGTARSETVAAAGTQENASGQIRAAVAVVCASQSIPFDRDLTPAEDEDPVQILHNLLQRANLRYRKIALSGRWWKTDGASFVAFDREADEAVAILRRSNGGFERLSFASGRRTPVTPTAAKALGGVGYVIFKPLPFRPLKAMDLVRHVLATPARLDMRWAGILAILTAALGLVTPALTGQLLNEIVPFAETETLLHLALGLGFVAIGSAMFQVVRSIALLRVEAFADGSLQAAVWDRLLRLPLTFYRRYEVGDLLIKAMGPTQLRQTLSDTAMSSLLSAVFSVVNFGLMVVYSGKLALAAFLFTLVTGLILFALARMQLRFERDQLKADAAVSTFILQVLGGISKIRLMGAEDRAFARWIDRFSDQRTFIVRAAKLGNIIDTLNVILPLGASLLFFYIVGSDASAMSVGSFVAFNAAFGGFNGAFLGLVGAVSESLSAVPIYENMKPILDAQPEVEPDRKAAPDFKGAMALSGVSFRYDADGPLILDGIDIDIEPGQFVAFVGPSGSGKSTIFRLLLGFETPETGTVSYDGQDLDRLDLRTVRRQVGVVLQRGAILPGSIYENIVGSAPLSQEAAWEAARMAGFDDDVRNMPMGMHTVLAEGGGTLSGGQRQRLKIARAIVRKPRILLMDEATSALDNRTQAIVSESLTHLNATRVVIAHRLSTIVNADRIFVIDAGRVVQSGPYETLITEAGPFQDLARRQIA